MADGNNLIIGRLNQGDNVTLLDRNGVPPTVAFAVSNANGNGILGTATSATSSFIGVVGQSASGIGVLADGQTGLKSRGVQGNGIETDSGSGFGLLARSKSSTGVQATGKLFGVEAFSNGRDLAAGVRGTAVRGVLGFGSEIGVAGTVNTTAGTLTSAFVGVSGRSNSSHGVFGGSTAPILPGPLVGGVTGVSNQNGLLGESTGTAFGVFGRSRNGVGVGGVALTSAAFAGWFKGDVAVFGNVAVTGAKSAVMQDAAGKYRRMYAVESPESWFEDFGWAKLVRGRVHVALKRDFAQFIGAREYHVFLTPEGDSCGLYVNRKTRTGFDVVEQQKGRSNIRFSYRIVAKRRDLQGRRLEEFKPPSDLPKIDGKIRAPKMPEEPAELKSLARSRKTKSRPAQRRPKA